MKQTKVTTEQLKQFWNHNIHPITGLKINKSDLYTNSERAERATKNKLKKTYNKE